MAFALNINKCYLPGGITDNHGARAGALFGTLGHNPAQSGGPWVLPPHPPPPHTLPTTHHQPTPKELLHRRSDPVHRTPRTATKFQYARRDEMFDTNGNSVRTFLMNYRRHDSLCRRTVREIRPLRRFVASILYSSVSVCALGLGRKAEERTVRTPLNLNRPPVQFVRQFVR